MAKRYRLGLASSGEPVVISGAQRSDFWAACPAVTRLTRLTRRTRSSGHDGSTDYAILKLP